MSKSERKKLPQVETIVGAKEVSTTEIEGIAEGILEALDKSDEAGVERRDPFSQGPIRVRRDGDGRVFIRIPRGMKISTRLELRKGKLCWQDNKKKLAAFLEKNRLALSFLERIFKPRK